MSDLYYDVAYELVEDLFDKYGTTEWVCKPAEGCWQIETVEDVHIADVRSEAIARAICEMAAIVLAEREQFELELAPVRDFRSDVGELDEATSERITKRVLAAMEEGSDG